jgi:hypothetical protein
MTLEGTVKLPFSKTGVILAYLVAYVLVIIGAALIILSKNGTTTSLLLLGILIIACGMVEGYVTGDLMNMYFNDPQTQIYVK